MKKKKTKTQDIEQISEEPVLASEVHVEHDNPTGDISAVMDFANFGGVDYEEDIDNYPEDYEGYDRTDDETLGNLAASQSEHPEGGRPPFFGMPGMQIEIPNEFEIDSTPLPILRVSHGCACPYVPMSLPQTIEENDPVIEKAIKTGSPVMLVYQDMSKYETGLSKGLSRVGVWGRVIRKMKGEGNDPDQLFVISGPRLKVDHFKVNRGKISVIAHKADWEMPEGQAGELRLAALFHELCDSFDTVKELEGSDGPRANQLLGMADEYQFVGSLLFSLSVAPKIKNEILGENKLTKVCMDMLHHLANLRQLLELRHDINKKVNKKIDAGNRENFIQHQIEMLQNEIGQGSVSDIAKLQERAAEKEWNVETKEHFERELGKLRRLSPNSPDYSIQFSYLDTLLNLPWNRVSEMDMSLDKIETTLNEDHFGLERVKERILEQMAVAALRNDHKSPIICLVGPPGVGKTSLGKSIARAMGREYGRVAFGGLHDEAEIRGHRRTYIGAMPGRIITALLKTQYSNPVIVLDEIDKIGKDYKGDPSTALLEVLDPEQNSKFHDNYIDTDYDLSRILFIATANSLETINGPLRDRMEIISIPGYIAAEKIEIAKRHLVAKELEANGLGDEDIRFSDEALAYIIEYYTRESGVRRLEKMIGKILRKLAVKKVRGQELPKEISKSLVSELLGKEEFNPEMYENNDSIGVVTGLAWTQVGGEILFIESSITEGKGKLTLTGNLGDVMKESATLALQYLKAHAEMLGLEQSVFDNRDVHIHVPEGAIPKDGPSAGITMATSLASSFTGRKVRPKVAMTGEITLRGKVLPVGGIREKIIAAKRAGIVDIILSKENEKDILEVKPEYLEGVSFHYVDNVAEVLELALEK